MHMEEIVQICLERLLVMSMTRGNSHALFSEKRYFLPNKAGGIITMGGAIAVLWLISFNNTSDVRNTTYRPIFKIYYWVLIAS